MTEFVFCHECNKVTAGPTCAECGTSEETQEVRQVSPRVFEELGSRCCFGGGHHRYAFVTDADGEVFHMPKACEITG